MPALGRTGQSRENRGGFLLGRIKSDPSALDVRLPALGRRRSLNNWEAQGTIRRFGVSACASRRSADHCTQESVGNDILDGHCERYAANRSAGQECPAVTDKNVCPTSRGLSARTRKPRKPRWPGNGAARSSEVRSRWRAVHPPIGSTCPPGGLGGDIHSNFDYTNHDSHELRLHVADGVVGIA